MRQLDSQATLVTCGCANACARSLIGPTGTPAASSSATHSATGSRTISSQHRRSHGAIAHAIRVLAKRGSAARCGEPGNLAEFRELTIVAHRQDQLAVGGREHLIGHDVGVRIADAARRLAARSGSSCSCWRSSRSARRAAPCRCTDLRRSRAMAQRGEDRDRRIHARREVGDRYADLLRTAPRPVVRSPVMHIRPPMRLDDEVVAGTCASARSGRSR